MVDLTRIQGIAEGVNDTDAVNKKQLDQATAGGGGNKYIKTINNIPPETSGNFKLTSDVVTQGVDQLFAITNNVGGLNLGKDSKAAVAPSLAIGTRSVATDTGAVSLGTAAQAKGASATACGDGSTAMVACSAFGSSASATGSNAVALGEGSTVIADNSVAVGQSSTVRNKGSLALGCGASAAADYSIALGLYSQTTQSKTLSLGGYEDEQRTKSYTMKIEGVTAGSADTDAVNKSQINKVVELIGNKLGWSADDIKTMQGKL